MRKELIDIDTINKDTEYVDTQHIFKNEDKVHVDNVLHVFNGLIHSEMGNRKITLVRMYYVFMDKIHKDKIKNIVLKAAFPRYEDDKGYCYNAHKISEDLFVIESFSKKTTYYYGVYAQINNNEVVMCRSSMAYSNFDSAIVSALAEKNRDKAIYNSTSACCRLLGIDENK